MRSLRAHLLAGVIGAVCVAMLVGAWATYRLARQEANDLFDYQLQQIALSLRDQTFLDAAERLVNDEDLDYVIRVWDRSGLVVYSSRRPLVAPELTRLGLSTVAGEDGKINLNTAPLPVLQALSEEMTPELAGDLIDFRGDERHREALATVDWYKQVSGFPAGVTLDRTVLKVTGSFFEVTVRAASPPFVRTGVATLQRLDNRTQRLLSWTIE